MQTRGLVPLPRWSPELRRWHAVLPSAALPHIPIAQSNVLSIRAPRGLRLFWLPRHSPEMFHQLLERHRQGSEIWDGKAHFMHAKMLCFAWRSPLPPQLGDLGLGQPRCLTSPWDHSWMQHRIAGSEGWGYGTAPHRPWYHTDPGTRLTPAPSTPPNRPGRSGVQTVPREQGGREMDTTASSLWLSPPGPCTTLCHTAGLQQDGDRVLHASACGQGNGAEGGGADVAGLARGAESPYLRALLPAAERRTQEQRSTHPIQRQRSPSCPRRASRCPSTAPSLEPR